MGNLWKINIINLSKNCWKSRLVATISEQFWSEVWSRLVSELGKKTWVDSRREKKSRTRFRERKKCQKRRGKEGPWRQSKNPPQILSRIYPPPKKLLKEFRRPFLLASYWHKPDEGSFSSFPVCLFPFGFSRESVCFFSADLSARSFFPWRTENNSARKSRI